MCKNIYTYNKGLARDKKMTKRVIGEILFAIGKGTLKSGDELLGVLPSLARGIKKFEPSSVIKNFGSASFFKNVKIPDVPLKTSNLFHTGDALKGLKKLDLKDLVPQKTSDLMKSLSKSVDEVDLSSAADIASSLKKVDAGDAAAIAKIANKSSFSKLKGISDKIAKNAKKHGDLVSKKAADKASLIDDAVDAKALKKANDLTDSLKKTPGLSKSVDDIVDNSTAAKKLDLGQLDDIAAQVKRLPALKRYDALLALGIIGSFMIAEHVTGDSGRAAATGENFGHLEELVLDPGVANEEAEMSDAGNSAEITTLDASDGDTVMGSNAVIAGVVAVGIASIAF